MAQHQIGVGGVGEATEEGLDWLQRTASNEKVACMAFGHRFPKPVPGRRRAKGLEYRAAPEGQGVAEIWSKCADCDERRLIVTAPHGVIDSGNYRAYIPPPGPGWKPPKGAGLRRWHYKAEATRRLRGEPDFQAAMEEMAEERAEAEE
jgi:hypothetical protein